MGSSTASFINQQMERLSNCTGQFDYCYIFYNLNTFIHMQMRDDMQSLDQSSRRKWRRQPKYISNQVSAADDELGQSLCADT
jgi:hypothetical protein